MKEPGLAERLMMAANEKTFEYRRVLSWLAVWQSVLGAHRKSRIWPKHWYRQNANVQCRMMKDGKPVTPWQAWEPDKPNRRGRSLPL